MYGGDMYIAAMTIINSVREVIHMPVSGVGNGAQPVMSFNYGAKEYGRVKQAIFFSMLRKVIIVVPLTFLLPMIPEIGVMGVFLAEPISNLIGGLVCFITMYVTVYRKLEA